VVEGLIWPFSLALKRTSREQPMRETVAPRVTSRPLILAVAAIILALGGTVWLWAQFGATVFFETIRAGLVACLG
jgi:fatty acid desaturase